MCGKSCHNTMQCAENCVTEQEVVSSVLHCFAVCRTLQYIVAIYPIVQQIASRLLAQSSDVAVCCSVLQCVLQHVAARCSMLQHVAVRCSMLQCDSEY